MRRLLLVLVERRAVARALVPAMTGGFPESGVVAVAAAASPLALDAVEDALGGRCASRKGSWASAVRWRGDGKEGLAGAATAVANALPRGTVRITGGGVTRRRSGTVGAEDSPLGREAGGLRGVVVGVDGAAPEAPTRGLRAQSDGALAAVDDDVPRGVRARPLRWRAGTPLPPAVPAPSDLDRVDSTGRAVATGEADSRGGLHDVSRLVKLAMVDGGCPASPLLSGERAAGGEGEADGPATLPAPAP